VRKYAFRCKKVSEETQFERDLGLTGDDGKELLEATEKRFGVTLCSEEAGLRETFNLGSNECLFHSEGIFPLTFTSQLSAVKPSVSLRLENCLKPFAMPEAHRNSNQRLASE